MESEAPWVDFITVQSSLCRATFHCIGHTKQKIRCRLPIRLSTRHEVRITLEPWENDIPPATDLDEVLEKLLCHKHQSLKNAYRRRWTDASAANCRRISTPPGRSQLAVPQIDRSRAGSAPPDVDVSVLDAFMYGVSSAKNAITAFEESLAGLTVSGTPDDQRLAFEQEEGENNGNASGVSNTEYVVRKMSRYQVNLPKTPPPDQLSQTSIRELELGLATTLKETRPDEPAKYIYVFTATDLPGLIKVGITHDVTGRRRQLMAQCRLECVKSHYMSQKLDQAKLVETLTHRVLKAWGLHVTVKCPHKGNLQNHREWFRCDKEVATQIIKVWEGVEKHYQRRSPDEWLYNRLEVYGSPEPEHETLEDMIQRNQEFWASS